ncbi:helix-turn-helix domain-containing protein [Lactococcus lactis]|uniref:helix-turn-helix domain-containing protein n=1 Tax=Lactococcus lactis TaxID=1358 RepID=UPI002417D718|nr:helix-turn-helix transcriptional regulator [Lactococcus lactis]
MFYNRLNTLVKMSGKSMNYIEKELNYPRNSLNNYKNCRMPSAIRVFELAQYFGVSPEYMIGLSATQFRGNDINFSELSTENKIQMYKSSVKWMMKEAHPEKYRIDLLLN